MSDKLTLFPTRIAIAQRVAGDTSTNVYMTPEFHRALQTLFYRVGGEEAIDLASLEILAGLSDTPVGGAPEPTIDTLAPIAAGPDVATRAQLEALQMTAAAPAPLPDPRAAQDEALRLVSVAEASDVRGALEIALAALCSATATAQALMQRIEESEMLRPLAERAPSWEQPGKIGFFSPNSAAFTTVSASGLLTANGAIRLNGTNSSTTGVGNYVRWSTNIIMQTEATNLLLITKIFNGAVFIDSMTVSSTAVSMPGTLTPVGGFGCNGKAAQTAFALGAAAVDLPTVIVLANNLRTMAINNGIGA